MCIYFISQKGDLRFYVDKVNERKLNIALFQYWRLP